MITRSLIEGIRNRLNRGKAIVLVGPRKVGKTTLINELAENFDRRCPKKHMKNIDLFMKT